MGDGFTISASYDRLIDKAVRPPPVPSLDLSLHARARTILRLVAGPCLTAMSRFLLLLRAGPQMRARPPFRFKHT